MSQPSITSFFSSRKRAAVDDISVRNKVLVLDGQVDDAEICSMRDLEKVSSLTPKPVYSTLKSVKLLSNKKDALKSDLKSSDLLQRIPKTQSKAVAKLTFDGQCNESAQTAISKALTLKSDQKQHNVPLEKPLVLFKKCGNLSPSKKKSIQVEEGVKITAFTPKQNEVANVLNTRNVTNNSSSTSHSRKLDSLKSIRSELSLSDIKCNLLKSPRLNELRARVSSIKNGLNKLESKNNENSSYIGKSEAILKTFDCIKVDNSLSPLKSPSKAISGVQNDDTDCIVSPKKEPLMSPRKGVSSPVKSPSKVPAYIRHASLTEVKPTLTLPYHYRFLGEVFRAIDIVSSMVHNRGETVTFAKIKPAVQEMLRRNVIEKHLEQISHLCPKMYTFVREKARNAGFNSKQDTYDLIMTPALDNGEKIMNSSILLARRRLFFEKLLSVAIDHHEKFLISLDPPMQIARNKLLRWHPDFELEKIPEVETAQLPQPPNVQHYSTARDVLARARQLFNCNARMERALEKLADTSRKEKAGDGVATEIQEASDASSSVGCQINGAVNATGLTNPALKNIPKSLLEKVKANKAARALEAMTRSCAKEKNILVYQRLPELARVLRNLYVTEKKSVLPLEIVISKLDNSFRSKLSQSDFEEYLKTLSAAVPRFLTFHNIRNGVYLRLEKTTDLNNVIESLQELSGDS